MPEIMMFKAGLKLWSTNGQYMNEAGRLVKEGCCDFVELYVIPGTPDEYLAGWRALDLPFTLHAPHFVHGVNLAEFSKARYNREVYEEVARWADALNAPRIVYHPGIGGDIRETARQLKTFNDSRILVENKPLIPPFRQDLRCNGATYEEIRLVLGETGLGFCLDVGHCFCTANSLGAEPMNYLRRFFDFSPAYFHLSDNDAHSEIDGHQHFGAGTMPLKEILGLFPSDSMVAIETQKDSPDNLDDFRRDVEYLNRFRKGDQ